MIHKSSVIDPKAKILKNSNWSILLCRSYVTLNENVELVSNAHIEGNTIIGRN